MVSRAIDQLFCFIEYTKNDHTIDLIFKNEKSEIILFSQAPTDELNPLVDNTESNPEKIEMNASQRYGPRSKEVTCSCRKKMVLFSYYSLRYLR